MIPRPFVTGWPYGPRVCVHAFAFACTRTFGFLYGGRVSEANAVREPCPCCLRGSNIGGAGWGTKKIGYLVGMKIILSTALKYAKRICIPSGRLIRAVCKPSPGKFSTFLNKKKEKIIFFISTPINGHTHIISKV